MKPDQISSLDSGVGAAASAGRSRGGCPGRNAGRGCAPRLYRRRQWAREALVQPCPAWVTKPPRPLLGDVRVGGSGGRGGGAATTTAAASTAAAFAGGRADVRGGGAPGAKRLGAFGPLVAAAATADHGVSGEGAAGEEQPLGGGGLSVAGLEAREGLNGETRAPAGGLPCKVWDGGG
ncbi:alanine and glycine-rich protein-like [Bos indicus]|uniref:Alanine and glycine-rich protein-like n=1 Tax=Bos indicus TaxID=9915 RepID=A0ABM4T377_BOSIN